MGTASVLKPVSAGLPPACDTPEYLSLRVGGRDYGIDLRHVQAIQPYDEGLRLMGASPWLCGVKDRQDAFVPLLDLRALVPAAVARAATPLRRGVVVVIELPQGRLGLLAEAVNDVLELSGAPVAGMPSGVTSIRLTQGPRSVQILDPRLLDGLPAGR
ncbi:chemotaxis protein CheW [Paucibacter sp. XJ19-41]|uniref:chemotaxis protein CheW n=1 Tax=Paucibacter sp. XJ19-41 TaxID=2927824 RepID=UPI00234B9FDE|nr:chemotaxis protein CheW [Paucibacter sp. XJ19-41]MDC6170450.1 chemotaxis protein CheW [Paucibacter sp. XJ19-41]